MKIQNFRKLMVNREKLNLEHNKSDLKLTIEIVEKNESGLILEVLVFGQIEQFGRTKEIKETYHLTNQDVRKDFQILIEDYLQDDEDWM